MKFSEITPKFMTSPAWTLQELPVSIFTQSRLP